MPLATSATAAPAGWQAGRADRVQRLEAALAAAQRRPHTARPRDGALLDDCSRDDDGSGSDDASSTHSDASSALYGEGQALLRTYQPAECPRAGRPPPPAKLPEQFLPWDRRLRSALQAICLPCCAGPDDR
ncbi:hypothetical protein H4R19_000973 [Coemansia spiralis]|nr:hypothetical protein H4R19_000973 [Coemansia spiralis]